MRLWRLTRAGHAALDGAGAALRGSRYAPPGRPVVSLASEAGLAVLAEARVDADRMMLATQSALDADGSLLTAAERSAVDQLMDDLRQARETGQDAAALEAATDALAKGTESFAAARMNHSIQKALAGKNVEQL